MLEKINNYKFEDKVKNKNNKISNKKRLLILLDVFAIH